VTDPRRSAVLVDVRLESLTGRPYKLYALLDPALSNSGDDDVGETHGDALVARDDRLASALVTEPAPTRVSSGYLGVSDGWTDLSDDFRMDWSYARAPDEGNVAQIAELPVTGMAGHRRATLALGFGASAGAASSTAGGGGGGGGGVGGWAIRKRTGR
jgi:glucoamylase